MYNPVVIRTENYYVAGIIIQGTHEENDMMCLSYYAVIFLSKVITTNLASVAIEQFQALPNCSIQSANLN